jgi:hypothetical protein
MTHTGCFAYLLEKVLVQKSGDLWESSSVPAEIMMSSVGYLNLQCLLIVCIIIIICHPNKEIEGEQLEY